MDKISAIILAVVTVLIVFAIIGSIVFIYPIVAGQQLTLPSDQSVKYTQGWKQYSLEWLFPQQGQLALWADNFKWNNYYPATQAVYLSVAQGATYNLSGFGLKITIISGVNSYNLVISVSPTSFWQATIIIYLTVIAILLAVIIALLLLTRHRKTANLKQ
jgi:hypothetical protein